MRFAAFETSTEWCSVALWADGEIAALERRARSGENLLPTIATAVEAYATVGEISDALRRVFGEYTESVVL